MQTTREARGGRGVDVRSPEMLGTLATHAPLIEEFQFVKFRVEGEVAHLRLDRPDQNLLNERMLMEIAAGINSVSEKRQVKLVIVVLNGPAYGGGAELAALGDLVIATPNAKFAQPEIKLGAFPPLAAAVLPYILGPKMAMELVLTGEAMSAERAREVGLVNFLVPEDKLVDKVNEIIGRVTAQSGPVLTMAKKAILGSLGLPLREGVRNSMKVFLNELADLEDSQEGLRALVEKRAPKWKNR